MLRAISSVLKPGGRQLFYAITLATGLSDQARKRAIRQGNEHVGAEPGYRILMKQAGFEDIEVMDVTDDYLSTMEAWSTAWGVDSDALTQLLGETEYNRRIELREVDIAAVRSGLLMRYLISGVKA